MAQIGVFISHASNDADLARQLITALEKALKIPARRIRCTSVDGYRLAGGADTDETLRHEIFEAETFLALLTPSSLDSTYVLFELGARWGARKHMIPLLGKGATAAVMKGPLSGLNALNAAIRQQVLQLVEEIGTLLSLPIEPLSSFQHEVDAVVASAALNAEVAAHAKSSVQSDPTVPLQVNLSDDELTAVLQEWLGQRSPSDNVRTIYFEKVDTELGIPRGTAKRLIELAARRYNYIVDKKGENLILFKSAPSRIRIAGMPR